VQQTKYKKTGSVVILAKLKNVISFERKRCYEDGTSFGEESDMKFIY